MTSETRAWIGTALRLALAGILFWAGFVKLIEPDGARTAIIAYRVFPAFTVDFLAWALPAAEVGLAVLLFVGLFTRLAALATAVLMVSFIVAISSVWIRGYSIDCGCFGGGGDVSEDGKTWRYTSELLRDFLFTGMAVWLVAWPQTKFSLDRWPSSTVTWAHDDDTRDNDTSDDVTGDETDENSIDDLSAVIEPLEEPTR